MTLGEFRKATANMPEHMELFVAERKTEFGFGLVNSVYQKEIRFTEDPEDIKEDDPLVNVLVIDEE